MARHIRYPSIDQFRSVVKTARDASKKYNVPLPTLTFRGTVKLHGTNSSVIDDGTEMWAQSRERVITPLQDNAGFAQFAETRKDVFRSIVSKVRQSIQHLEYTQDGETLPIAVGIFGEWIGQGVQSGVAVSQLSKRFVIFSINISVDATLPDGEPLPAQYLSEAEIVKVLDRDELAKHNIFDVFQFPTWTIKIDMATPELIQNTLGEITLAVEKECPAGKFFGVTGIGEGVVWTCIDHPHGKAYLFKVKGEKHSVSKVRTLGEVDLVKVNNIVEFVDRTVTENRLMQMYDKMTELMIDRQEIRNVSQFLKMVGTDVIKEELDVLEASGLTTKDVMGKVSEKARNWYIDKLEGKIDNVRP